ncbi:myocyte-specific enhancer factor 2-like isoform X2 [Daktulosphaira vitifoliae]|uniref:myocyte-specific enhancer factor 2-like isoform X2 n=1 Tax=Daktulosphaira vitifoliae TaxID=58002 RepID=UPI0021AAE01F|nr:myocyte-specific enhancer factor 2-like isoform X2 [Daktulosphaira vitifoliae]
MGRKKIQISRITDERNRQVTFNKRKFGVMKKAYELSVLCDCEIALIIFSSSNKLYQYASTDMDKVLLKYTEYNEPHESLTNKNIIEQLNKKELKGGAMSPESPDESCDGTQGPYQLTPRTEAKYSKIDEEFQLLMQHQRMARNNVNANYPLPTSMPVSNMYNESGNLQIHHSASPRPPSSDADSVYPAGSMLEMSNGYQTSSSPALVNSPSSPAQLVMSPSPTPKALNASNRSTPPPRHHSPRPNLRIVMPNAASHHDDTDSNAINTPTVSLNTPVVALHTPGLGGSYHGIFTDLTSSDMGLSSALNWSNQIAHNNNGMSHLGVPNSPPPSQSPNSVRIKSEPNSPPHLHHHTSAPSSTAAPNTVVSHSISHLSLPHAHSSIPSHHLSVAGGQIPGGNQGLVDSRHEFDGGPPPKRLRDTWPT